MKAPVYGTKVEGVFACGDARTGQSLVVTAIAEGRRCARVVDQYLGGSGEVRRVSRRGDVRLRGRRPALAPPPGRDRPHGHGRRRLLDRPARRALALAPASAVRVARCSHAADSHSPLPLSPSPVLWLWPPRGRRREDAHAGRRALPGPPGRGAAPLHRAEQRSRHEYLRFSNLVANTGRRRPAPAARAQHSRPTSRPGIQEILDAQRQHRLEQAGERVRLPPRAQPLAPRPTSRCSRSAPRSTTARGGRFGAVFADQSHQDDLLPDRRDQARRQLANTATATTGTASPTRTRASPRAGVTSTTTPRRARSSRSPDAKPRDLLPRVDRPMPRAAFLETDTTNNTAWTSFRLTRDSKGNAKVAEVAHSPCSRRRSAARQLPNR